MPVTRSGHDVLFCFEKSNPAKSKFYRKVNRRRAYWVGWTLKISTAYLFREPRGFCFRLRRWLRKFLRIFTDGHWSGILPVSRAWIGNTREKFYTEKTITMGKFGRWDLKWGYLQCELTTTSSNASIFSRIHCLEKWSPAGMLKIRLPGWLRTWQGESAKFVLAKQFWPEG